MPRGILPRTGTYIAFIIVLGVLAYANSINVPFDFDDAPNIVDNPIVKDFSYFTDSERAAGLIQYDALRLRYIGYLTFLLNYKVHGLEVTGYHIVNVFIHFFNSLLVYALVTLSFQTSVLRGSSLATKRQFVALLAASLFIVHPVNTQAVTYTVQRLASLVALFYLGSMVCYIMARLSEGKGRWLFYFGALFLAVLAMKTKENAFTLPMAIAFYEFMFFRDGALKKRALLIAPFILTMLIIPMTLIELDKPASEVMSDISEKTTVRDISRYSYFLTELRVMVTYLRLLVLPMNQNLDYDYPLYSSVTQVPVMLSLALLLALVILAVYLNRRKEAALKLGAFGVPFFFLALSVESTLVPLQPIYEHRAYLPGVGIMMAVSVAAVFLYQKIKNSNAQSIVTVLGTAIIILLLVLTVQRNTVWQNELSLWSDVVQKAPRNARGQFNLGVVYRDRGDIEKAIDQYRIAIMLKPDYAEAHYNLAVRLSQQGDYEEAIEHYNITISLMPEFSTAYHNLGVVHFLMGHFKQAEKNFRLAQIYDPENPQTYNDLSMFYISQGDMENAISELKQSISLDENNVESHYRLGLAYFNKGLYPEAEQEIGITLRLSPDHREAKELRKILMK